MPTYEYECIDNQHPYTEVRSITEDQQRTVCVKPDCGSTLRRVFSPTATIFKGAGFASTDIQSNLLKKGQVVDY
jgi:putative FmdB family regulatory protein